MKYKLVDLKCPHCEKQLGFAWNRKNSLQNGVCPHCGGKAQTQLNLQRSLLALPIALMVGWLFFQLIPFLPALFWNYPIRSWCNGVWETEVGLRALEVMSASGAHDGL